MCLKLPQMTLNGGNLWKGYKEKERSPKTMSVARQPSPMETWKITEDTTVADFVIPSK